MKIIITESQYNRIKFNKFPLSALVNFAKQFDDFDSFENFYSMQQNYGYFWHITHNPNFKISNTIGPRDVSSMSSGFSKELGAIMITANLETWDELYNGEKITRPYAALFDASNIEPKYLKPVDRGFGHEIYLKLEQANKLNQLGVYDIKKARKLNNKFEQMIPGSKEELYEIWEYANN